ncbi:MAG: FliA/WhiG family RNA polymerase sigma factor [bacterium]|jgi:RNA polymerase sigma factor for flagellar operon FliA
MVTTDKRMADEALWRQYKQSGGLEAREALITKYVHLVKYVASRMAINLPPSIEFDDLVSYGVFGLIDGIEKFDYLRGIKFETYCIARIKGSIIDGLRALDWVPQSVKKKRREVEAAFSRLEAKLGRAATDAEAADCLGLTTEEFGRLLQRIGYTSVVSLEDIIGDDRDGGEGLALLEIIPDANADDPVRQYENAELKTILAAAIEKLPEKEKMVVTLFYYEGLMTKEIAAVMELSESRISQLHTKSILRLRGSLSRFKKTLFN